jgi:hypothetical protein
MPHTEENTALATKLGIKLPEVDDQDRLIRPVAEGDREEIAAAEREWTDEDL